MVTGASAELSQRWFTACPSCLKMGAENMKNIFEFRMLLGTSIIMALISAPPAVGSPITLSNATTILQVNGGEANNGLVPFDGYFRYTDIATHEETTWSIDPVLRFSNGTT